MISDTAKLTLVGAGPGDPELLTLKAVSAIKDADVVLYDALVNPELLKFADRAEKIFVGKRKGCHTYMQDQINELIVQRAFSKGHVVRLKGGDPFVFGRGAEEMQYAASFGIACSYIPGISSSVGVPGTQHIPLTKRGISNSFWVITGTTRSHRMSPDIKLAAASSATVVILMGMHKLHEIVQTYRDAGKDRMPIAVIENGTCANERIGIGTIDCIEQIVINKNLKNPAVIIIGEVVYHRKIMFELYQTSGSLESL
ncbi:uroporphyrinogen-III C-methyltransferase [Robertkochia solimangrovi]|uniref:uroporphyrinogen-III C-methyltransferase n=1 Tax=Robertkochia solimangrovi TaxID=2213046 RepID=UPI00117EA91D|nr:uroporphyrinogen-III C-methyltransferase [Robertkochia solimangrovi]TRZ42289.1 uroporphyrinogen-III C-methyltransferase [Robertkochia solimangrovi]